MTRLETRGEQQARKHHHSWIPLEEPTLSNLDRLDRGMPAETFGEPMRNKFVQPVSFGPFWTVVGVLGVLLGFAVMCGVVGGAL